MELAYQVFNVTAPVILCCMVGAFWTRSKLPFETATLTPLIMYIGAPCLLLANFSKMTVDPGSVVRLLAAAAAAHVAFAVLGWLYLRLRRLPVRLYLPCLIFNNSGNLGLPLCLLAFGQEGLYLGLAYLIVDNMGLFSVGPWINSGQTSLTSLLRTPTLLASIIAISLAFSGINLPVALHATLKLLGDMTIPLMLLALGASLCKLQVRNFSVGVELGAFKVLTGVVSGLGLSWLIGLEGVARDVFLLQNVMPPAVFNYLMAEHYGQNGAQVAGVIVVASLMGLGVIPLMLAALL